MQLFKPNNNGHPWCGVHVAVGPNAMLLGTEPSPYWVAMAKAIMLHLPCLCLSTMLYSTLPMHMGGKGPHILPTKFKDSSKKSRIKIF